MSRVQTTPAACYLLFFPGFPGSVLAVERVGDRLPPDFPRVDGCQERSFAAGAALRCAGVPAAFVRWRQQSVPMFKHGGKTYVANRWLMLPGEPPCELVHPITPAEENRMEADLKKGFCRVGLDTADVGMRSITDFWVAMGAGGRGSGRHSRRGT